MVRLRRMWTRFQEKSRCRLFEDDDEVHNDYNNVGENKDEDADDVPKSNDGDADEMEEGPRKSTTYQLMISYTCWLVRRM